MFMLSVLDGVEFNVPGATGVILMVHVFRFPQWGTSNFRIGYPNAVLILREVISKGGRGEKVVQYE